MAIRQIRGKDEEILRKKCKEVKEITPRILEMLDDMVDTLNADEYGVGLAAPQVGILKRMVVIDIGEGMIELINPVIVETSGSQTGYEACLSVPGVKGIVTRPNYVKVEALNRKGEKFTVDGTELLARAFCHEIDHLDGILYIDHVEGELQSSYEDFEVRRNKII